MCTGGIRLLQNMLWMVFNGQNQDMPEIAPRNHEKFTVFCLLE